MSWWQWLIDIAGVLLLVCLVYGAALFIRRRVLARGGGTFEMSHRIHTGREGRGWVLGVGRYSADHLDWFRVFSMSPRPKRTWQRDGLRYAGHRRPEGQERTSLYPDHIVISCHDRDDLVELAMSPASLTGFQSWLEARPPGTDWTRRR